MGFPICLINKIQCFKTLIFFLTHGPDEIFRYNTFQIKPPVPLGCFTAPAPVHGGVGGRDSHDTECHRHGLYGQITR
ncbi:hypothetical protein HanRHA438_Chr07g0309111 [Helianthus annuus]|nr:hypothetical protein HanRHA438_Chr07g0309111 [Helianthus annuus]